jgi:hypothetical protein
MSHLRELAVSKRYASTAPPVVVETVLATPLLYERMFE